MPKYCARSTASIALTARRFGYRLHGHDIVIKLCIDTNEVINLTEFSGLVKQVVSRYDRILLEDIIGDDAIIEDLLARILSEMKNSLATRGVAFNDLWCEASIPDGDIIVSIGELAEKG